MAAQRIARAEEQVEEGLKEWDPAKDPEAAARSQALQGFLTLYSLPRLHAVRLIIHWVTCNKYKAAMHTVSFEECFGVLH